MVALWVKNELKIGSYDPQPQIPPQTQKTEKGSLR